MQDTEIEGHLPNIWLYKNVCICVNIVTRYRKASQCTRKQISTYTSNRNTQGRKRSLTNQIQNKY